MEHNDAEIASNEELAKRIPSKELSTLLKVSNSLASTLELPEVLQIAIESATDLLNLDTGAIYTLENGGLRLGATTPPLPDQFPDELRHANLWDHPHIEKAISTKKPVYLDNARTEPLTAAEKTVVDTRHLVSILYFPLLLKEEAIGTFIVGTTNEIRSFTNTQINVCHLLSGQVSFAIANAKLYSEAQQAISDLNQAYDATLEGWSRLLDMRDHLTDSHTHRVAKLAVALARRMGIPESEMVNIRRGAFLHDIGKIGIPDAILQKPDELSETELAIIKTHPEKAYEILSHIDHLKNALDIPYCHHEKWDGSGYPRNLKGKEIPIAARIFAVVDVYDAITSDRPYREVWNKDKALKHIQSESGKYFDPEVVEAFIEMIK